MIKKMITVLSIIILISILSIEILNINEIYNPVFEPQDIINENGSINMVSAIVLDYRLIDTFFEVLVFTLSVIGISFYMEKLPEQNNISVEENSIVVKIITPILFQIIVLVTLYISVTGHLGPGGGFTAGVILGTGLIGVSFVKPIDEIEKIFIKSKIEKVKILVPLIIALYGLLGYFWNGAFFSNIPLKGNPGELFSGGGAMLLNILIAFEVFAGTWTILYKFIKHRGTI
ncbi:hypothetical protein OF820_03410 [Oceanotoga sp. DSM 15011]|uniref:MnhB domain-containing protein n=1 Tax=Oceanotoga sp. DSM 15011 TaxID=2984951 RepID=UPI0021F4C527|nr:MnhB domain-containing protein [Oceanotoga sp. DSM 15011]UYP00735.1 hypothetical protein OF820_03410 [Oceanotoga sp. DSM 15011]